MAKTKNVKITSTDGDVTLWFAHFTNIRGQHVILDDYLAEVLGIDLKELNSLVEKNTNRLPPDFMFQLTEEEVSQYLNESILPGVDISDRKPLPLAFTANGLCMLCALADTRQAIEGHIEVVRYLSRSIKAVDSNDEAKKRLVELEAKIRWSKDVQLILGYLDLLHSAPEYLSKKLGEKIGFVIPVS